MSPNGVPRTLLFFGDALAEHLRRWSKSFADLGYEVHVVTWNPRILPGYEPVAVHQLAKLMRGVGPLSRGVNFLALTAEIRQLIKRLRPDLIHAHDAGAYGWMAALSGFRPVVITPWGSDILIHVHTRAVDRFLTARALRRADLVHAEGEDTRDALLRLGVSPERIVVLPLGVDIDRFCPGAPPSTFVGKYHLGGTRVVVSTRTLNPVHDVETTIRAASLVLQIAPEVKFLIVGGGIESQRLRELAQSLGIARAVLFTGHLDEPEMVECLQTASVYVSTSLSDSGTPASTAEAMACGLPIVTTDVGNIRSRIRDGEGGYIVPVGSPREVADRVLRLLASDEERALARSRNRRHIEEHYDVRKVIRKMQTLYGELMSRSHAGGAAH